MKQINKSLFKNVDIIVAHYSEDIDWVKPYADYVTIYHKWKEDKPRFPVKKRIKIENVWREWETYLQHIINNYDNLADITIFLQWWMHDQLDNKVAYRDLEEYVKEVKKYWFSTSRTRFILRKNPQIVFSWKFLFLICIKIFSMKSNLYCSHVFMLLILL